MGRLQFLIWLPFRESPLTFNGFNKNDAYGTSEDRFKAARYWVQILSPESPLSLYLSLRFRLGRESISGSGLTYKRDIFRQRGSSRVEIMFGSSLRAPGNAEKEEAVGGNSGRIAANRAGKRKRERDGMSPPETDVTLLLSRVAAGNQEAANELVPLVYEELKRLARGYMRRERPDHTLQATALVNEAYLKLVRQHDVNWQGRSHFFGIAAQLMRRILIDHARGNLREKRGGAQEVLPLNEALAFSPEKSEELVKLDEVLERLSQLDPRQGRIVELRFFGGLSVEETAEFLGISPKTVKRDWAVAKAWLHGELKQGQGKIVGEAGSD
jgi:RNA polymerase sigma factor (TIGR02999 family)